MIIPTFDRPAALDRCLAGLRDQTQPPNEVVVVIRPNDQASRHCVGRWSAALPILIASVERPGLVQALNAGLSAVDCDVVAFVDDDAVPRPQWLARIIATYASEGNIGGVGGRDVVHHGGRIDEGPPVSRWRRSGAVLPVGRVRWYGKVVGNHHRGQGSPRDVDILKGANMSYRRRALPPAGFDVRMAGIGSQVHNELSVCLPLRRAGWRIVYDPKIIVDHYPASRQEGDHRGSDDPLMVESAAHNETLSVLPYLSTSSLPVYAVWVLLAGSRSLLGMVQIPRLWSSGQTEATALFVAAIRGRWRAASSVRRDGPERQAAPSVSAGSPE